ncbi:YKE2 [Candida margitis]|uniref:YKE2 n=1 Tax=Candida margitis TaxID=1775924 RepID=UPI0022272914|nr:YKE2 [Candida margitis]KAI5969715.1 YKE2 [Candida margitis]
MSDLNKKLETLSLQFSNHQSSLNDLIASRSTLETQYQENKIVEQEFTNLSESDKIYKLTGPVLLPQDYAEASMNVNKRIEFITGEIKRVETKIEVEEGEMEKIRGEIIALRTQQS